MATGEVLLGLLVEQPRHGYDLKRAYDERFGADRPLRFGQVYATLARLLRDGLVDVDAVEAGDQAAIDELCTAIDKFMK